MREILFRGKCIYGGDWVNGLFLIDINDKPLITHTDWQPLLKDKENDECLLRYSLINIDTLGQYTGLKDKNGNKIFEGDIVRATPLDARDQSVSYDQRNYVCLFWEDAGRYVFDIGINNRNIYYTSWWGNSTLHTGIEIVGNIHDNPELLKEKDN